eukprot:CAMPEP_0206466826 /NCGR_PEP_ID=MMETSP0324_2-20121206/28687_1 /ASSEMBLY_ACC=CAM_ASM_000836 /TAXON_ID=2866 /ORGANISM="Crypthecodinium cohnii, Strain Seligo" /LENGTH=66 /DNA_ID=CAMNT_0053940011 /DNA_START=145 /DNA_END=345 /DNA_ORIENTATION=+
MTADGRVFHPTEVETVASKNVREIKEVIFVKKKVDAVSGVCGEIDIHFNTLSAAVSQLGEDNAHRN